MPPCSPPSHIARYDGPMNEVRDLRVAAGLTQQQLAERAGVPQPNIAAYESGRRTPAPATLDRIRKAVRPLPHDALAARRAELIALARRHGLANLRVFGSVARGEDGPDSDLDLLATATAGVGLLALATFVEEAEELLGVTVDVVTDGGLPPGHPILTSAVAA